MHGLACTGANSTPPLCVDGFCKMTYTHRMETETEARFIALETKIAFLEDFVGKLQSEAVANAKAIEILREENKILAGRYEELAENLDIPNRKPPHY